MNNISETRFSEVYRSCRSVMTPASWSEALRACLGEPELFPDILPGLEGTPAYLQDLARIELERSRLENAEKPDRSAVTSMVVNPTLRLMVLGWRNLTDIINNAEGNGVSGPVEGAENVIVWLGPYNGKTFSRAATDADLLALKMVVEGISVEEVAKTGGVTRGEVERVIHGALDDGIIMRPPSLLVRDPEVFPGTVPGSEEFLSTGVFTLQWHITQACDLHCKHCYDRSERTPMPLEKAIGVLEDMHAFCEAKNVNGQVSFSGGNPLLYPRFDDLYRAAVDMGFGVGILGNPTSWERLEEITKIQIPSFYQVSMEGLEEHNDTVRGRGHYTRVMAFLEMLKEQGVYSMVMLTLTRDNVDEVIPLALELEGLTPSFNFNRLSMVGEGARLSLPGRERFITFMEEYLDASMKHPHMRLKDNLFNILLQRRGMELFDGCTGHGCGAAFNFMTVLSDGSAHACRKFPSPIGNVFEQGIAGVYDSEDAGRYRKGCRACDGCGIRDVCGGCLSIAHSFGLDIFTERDPYCFINSA